MDRNFENLPNHSQERTVETKPATLAPQHRTPRAHFEDLEAPPNSRWTWLIADLSFLSFIILASFVKVSNNTKDIYKSHQSCYH